MHNYMYLRSWQGNTLLWLLLFILFIYYFPQPEAVNAFGCTPLHVACNNGQDIVVDVLLQYQLGRNPLNNRGQTPLHYAAFSHHGALCMELLVKAGADPNIQDMDGRTPLHMTALHGFYLRTETLISQGGCPLLLLGRGEGREYVWLTKKDGIELLLLGFVCPVGTSAVLFKELLEVREISTIDQLQDWFYNSVIWISSRKWEMTNHYKRMLIDVFAMYGR